MAHAKQIKVGSCSAVLLINSQNHKISYYIQYSSKVLLKDVDALSEP